MEDFDKVENLILKKKLDAFPEIVKDLILIGNYIETVKNVKPSPIRLYWIYLRYFTNQNISLATVTRIILSYRNIWKILNKPGYVILKKDYKFPKDFVINHLKAKNKLGLEDLYYIKFLLNYWKSDIIPVFLYITKYKDIKTLNKDAELKKIVKKLKELGLIDIKRNSVELTSKGWKLYFTIKNLFYLLGDKGLFYELKF